MPSGKVASTCRVLLSTGISSVRSTLLSDCRRRSRRSSSSSRRRRRRSRCCCCCCCCCRRCRSGPAAPASRGRELNGFPTPNPTRPLSTAHGSGRFDTLPLAAPERHKSFRFIGKLAAARNQSPVPLPQSRWKQRADTSPSAPAFGRRRRGSTSKRS